MNNFRLILGIFVFAILFVFGCGDKDKPDIDRGPYSFTISNNSSFDLTDVLVFTKNFIVINSIYRDCDTSQTSEGITIDNCLARIDRTIYDISGESTNKTEEVSFKVTDNYTSLINKIGRDVSDSIESIVYTDSLQMNKTTDVLYSKYPNVMISFKNSADKQMYTSMSLYELNTSETIQISIEDEMQVYSKNSSYTTLQGDTIKDEDLELEWLVKPDILHQLLK